jgi:hypothetical protein
VFPGPYPPSPALLSARPPTAPGGPVPGETDQIEVLNTLHRASHAAGARALVAGQLLSPLIVAQSDINERRPCCVIWKRPIAGPASGPGLEPLTSRAQQQSHRVLLHSTTQRDQARGCRRRSNARCVHALSAHAAASPFAAFQACVCESGATHKRRPKGEVSQWALHSSAAELLLMRDAPRPSVAPWKAPCCASRARPSEQEKTPPQNLLHTCLLNTPLCPRTLSGWHLSAAPPGDVTRCP